MWGAVGQQGSECLRRALPHLHKYCRVCGGRGGGWGTKARPGGHSNLRCDQDPAGRAWVWPEWAELRAASFCGETQSGCPASGVSCLWTRRSPGLESFLTTKPETGIFFPYTHTLSDYKHKENIQNKKNKNRGKNKHNKNIKMTEIKSNMAFI